MDTRLIVSFVECVSEKHVRGERLAMRVVEIGIRGVDRRVRAETERAGAARREPPLVPSVSAKIVDVTLL
jgi:hypothetical protein